MTLKKWQKWEKMMWKWSIRKSFRIIPRRFLDLQDIKKHSGEIQKTYSRTSKMVGYFELSAPLSEHLLRGSDKSDFWSRTPSQHLQIDMNSLLHIWTKVQQPRTAVQQVFWHPTFDTQKMTKMIKNDVKMIYPKFIQNRSQEVPVPSGHRKTFKNNVQHPPEPFRDV